MRITQQERECRRNRMIRAAYELFCEYGINNVTMKNIAIASNVSTNSIFRYFESKASLVECTQNILWEEVITCILSDNKELFFTAKSGFEEIKLLLLSFQNLYEHYSKYLLFACDAKMFLVQSGTKRSKEAQTKKLQPVYDIFTQAIERGRRDGSISKDEMVNAQFYAVWGAIRGFCEQIVIYDQSYFGINPWKEQFQLIVFCVLEALKNKDLKDV